MYTLPSVDALDHLLLGVADREAGIRWVEERTGVRAVIGGTHPGVGTHNALLSLGGRQYLEIIAPDPAQAQLAPHYECLPTLDTPRLIMWAAVTGDADAAAARFRDANIDVTGPHQGSRSRPDGTRLQWRTLFVTSEFETMIPFFIEWDRATIHPAVDAPPGCRLHTFALVHPQPELLTATLARLGIVSTARNGLTASLTAVLHTPRGMVELV